MNDATEIDRLRAEVARLQAVADDDLLRAERSSAAEAASVLMEALGWASGGLGSAAREIVAERDRLKMSLAGRDKAIALLNAGFESTCEDRDRLKQESRRLEDEVDCLRDAAAALESATQEVCAERDQIKASLRRVAPFLAIHRVAGYRLEK